MSNIFGYIKVLCSNKNKTELNKIIFNKEEISLKEISEIQETDFNLLKEQILNILKKPTMKKEYIHIKSWDKEKCAEIAKKYTDRTSFCKGNNSAYLAARMNGWLDDICIHMNKKNKSSLIWCKEKCLEKSKKYKNKSEFFRENYQAYNIANDNGWLEEFFPKPKYIKFSGKREQIKNL